MSNLITNLGIYDNLRDLPAQHTEPVTRQFGGIRIYATTQNTLEKGISRVSLSIVGISASIPCANLRLLRYLVEKDISCAVPKRTFSALLGRQLRLGVLDAFLCEGTQGTPFRVFLHKDRKAEFAFRLKEVAERLVALRTMHISAIREKQFSRDQQGGWTQATYVAARLVRLGFACYVDRNTIEMPDAVENAIVRDHHSFHTVDDTGLVAR